MSLVFVLSLSDTPIILGTPIGKSSSNYNVLTAGSWAYS